MSAPAPILTVSHLSASIAGQQVVEDVSFEVPATGITAVLGRNGVGKTTVKTAIRWGLTGVCEQTDGRGLGWQTMVPDGSDTLAVGLKFSNGMTVERGYTPNDKALLVNNNPAEITIAQNAVYAGLHVQPSWLNAVLETGYFVDLSHGDAKALVLSLLDVKVDINLTPLASEQNRKVQRMTMDEVQAAHKDAFQKRATAKVSLKNHVVPAFQEPEGEMPTVEEVKQRLTDIRREKERLLATSGNVAGQRQALEQELRRLTATPAEIVPQAPAEADVEAIQAAIAEAESAMDAAVKELASRSVLVQKPRVAQGDVIPVEQLRSQASTLMNHQPRQGCVLDGNVPCETAKIKFTNRAKAIREEIESRGHRHHAQVHLQRAEKADKAQDKEALRARDLDVLFLTDAVDEWVVQGLTEFQGKKLVPIHKRRPRRARSRRAHRFGQRDRWREIPALAQR